MLFKAIKSFEIFENTKDFLVNILLKTFEIYIEDLKILKIFMLLFYLGLQKYLRDLKLFKTILKLYLSLLKNLNIFSSLYLK